MTYPPQRPATGRGSPAVVYALFVAAGAVFLVANTSILGQIDPIIIMLGAAMVALVGALVGIKRCHGEVRGGIFHPLIFPSLYVAITCLAPTLWLWNSDFGNNLDYIRRSSLDSQTPLLMALAVIGFVIGAATPFSVRRLKFSKEWRVPAKSVEAAAKLLLAVPLVVAVRGYLTGELLTRGLGQNTVTLADSVKVLAFLAAPTAGALILSSRLRQNKSLMSPLEWLMTLALLAFLGLVGKRAEALEVIVVVLIFLVYGRRQNLRAIFGLSAAALFAFAVVSYRTTAVGETTKLSGLAVLLRDIGSVPYTTGVTARVFDTGNYLNGSTIAAGVVRQLPGPIANRLFGQPNDTGSFQFRALTGLGSDSNGYGFSLPAEGVMNFGILGAFLLPLAIGIILAWLYSRFDPQSNRALQLSYAIAVGSLPLGLRADVLGGIKGVLYPAIIISLTMLLATGLRSYGLGQKVVLPDRQRARQAAAPVASRHTVRFSQ